MRDLLFFFASLQKKGFKPKHLIAIDIEDQKLALARQLGANAVINALDENLKQKLYALVGSDGLDYAVEAAGKTSTIELGFELIKKNGGQLIFASHPPKGEKIALEPFDLICGKSIRGSWGGGAKPDRDIAILGEIYKEGRLPLETLLSHHYKLEELNDALNDLEKRSIVRALIKLWD